MRFGVFGDVHGNLAALEAVLAAMDKNRCERLVCTGDLVGYGPDPAACVRRIRERGAECVLGNHDEFATLLDDDRFRGVRSEVLQSAAWTQQQLDTQDLKWLAALPLRLDCGPFEVVHGSFGPNPWAYVLNQESLADCIGGQHRALGFCGHTHMPLYGARRAGHPLRLEFLRSRALPPDEEILINVGAVGQPRDRDPRAACVIYDSEQSSIALLRLEYDVAATQARIREAGLPASFADRLSLGR